MTPEVEAKFAATDSAPLEVLARTDRLGAATLEPPHASDEVDRYLDTPAGALGAARWACRLRSRRSRTTVSLKGPLDVASEGWFHRRPELEGPGENSDDPADWPASAARDLVDRLRHGEPLAERFTLRQRRTERAVIVAGRRIGTLSLDVVRVERAGREAGAFHVVELELAGGADAPDESLLAPLAAELERIPGLSAEPASKLERALALLDGP